jgi:hypothetical protein
LQYEIRGTDSLVFYKISNDSFCEGLATLSITAAKFHQTTLYFPCVGKLQLENILFTDQNSFKVNSDQVYRGALDINVDEIPIELLKHHRYCFQLSLNFNNIESSTKENHYKESLISNKYELNG